MTIFWHHVGDQLSKRDFPRTIGTTKIGLREFSLKDIKDQIEEHVGPEHAELQDGYDRIGSSTFQIWGVPTGAKTALKNLKTGDWLLLLNSSESYGYFEYFDRVLLKVPGQQWKLSFKLWGEGKFPIILCLKGKLIRYPWPEFVEDMGYGSGLKGMGRVHSIGKAAVINSKFGSKAGLIDSLEKRAPQ
jgi:5-methylcytosine-specific restriction protein A